MADRRSLRWRCEGLATSATEDRAALETVAVRRGEQGARGRWLTGVEGTESLVRGRARARGRVRMVRERRAGEW